MKVRLLQSLFLLAVLKTLFVGTCSGTGVQRELLDFSKPNDGRGRERTGWPRWSGVWHCSKPDRGASRSLQKVVKKVDVRQCRSAGPSIVFAGRPVDDPKIDKRSASFVPTNTRRKMHWATNVFDKGSFQFSLFPSLLIRPLFCPFTFVWNSRALVGRARWSGSLDKLWVIFSPRPYSATNFSESFFLHELRKVVLKACELSAVSQKAY